MEINEADVAELVDARDLKSPAPTDPADNPCKTSASAPAETAANPAHLQNIIALESKRRALARLRPHAHVDDQPILSNLIEQIRNFINGDEAQRDALRRYMLASANA